MTITCPRCRSTDVTTQVLTDYTLKTQRKGCLWWLVVGWWWVAVKWIVFTLPALIFKLFGSKRQKIVTRHRVAHVCQRCGETWS